MTYIPQATSVRASARRHPRLGNVCHDRRLGERESRDPRAQRLPPDACTLFTRHIPASPPDKEAHNALQAEKVRIIEKNVKRVEKIQKINEKVLVITKMLLTLRREVP